MEITQPALSDLLARLVATGEPLYLSLDVDPHRLVESLAARHGAPRTLVLGGSGTRPLTNPAVRLSSASSTAGA